MGIIIKSSFLAGPTTTNCRAVNCRPRITDCLNRQKVIIYVEDRQSMQTSSRAQKVNTVVTVSHRKFVRLVWIFLLLHVKHALQTLIHSAKCPSTFDQDGKIYHCNILLKQCTNFNTLANSFSQQCVITSHFKLHVENLLLWNIYHKQIPSCDITVTKCANMLYTV